MIFGTPNKLPDGRYFVKVEGQAVRHQVNNVKMTVADGQTTIVVPASLTLFSEIDEQIVSQAKESKLAWFGKEISDETVVSAYQKSVNPELELSASLLTSKGKVLTTAYDTTKKQIELSDLPVDSPVDVCLELIGLVFTKRAFEPVWKVIQVRIKSAPKSKFPREYLFEDGESEEDQEVDL